MQHIEASHAFHAGDNVADHVIADVSNMGVARGIREHFQTVVFRSGIVFSDLERRALAAIVPAISSL